MHIERIAHNSDRIARNMGAAAEGAEQAAEAVEDVGAAAEAVAQRMYGIGRQVDDMFERMHQQEVLRIDFLFEEWDRFFERLNVRWQNYNREVQRHMTDARGPFGTAGAGLGVSGGSGIYNTTVALKNQLFSELPMGGLLGLMLFGVKKEDEFAAAGWRAARVFAQVGRAGRDETTYLAGLAGKLYEEWGMSYDELQALSGALVEFGQDGEAAMTDVGFGIDGLGRNVLGVTFAMDTLTKSATGTFGKAVAQAVQQSDEPIAKVTRDIVALGLEVRGTGVTISQFLGVLGQAGSSLRTQRQDVAGLAEAYLRVRAGLERSLGVGGATAASLALAGLTATAQGVAGLPEGLQGFLGQRMGLGSGIEAIVGMREGFAGGDRNFIMQAARQLGTLASEITGNGTRAERIYALEKVAPGLGFEGSRAIVDMAHDIDAGLDMDELMEKHGKELANVTRDRAAEQSAWEQAMRRLTMQLVDIGMGSLVALIAGFKALSPDALIGSLKTAFGRELSPDEQAAVNAARQAADIMWGPEGFGRVAEGFGSMGGIGGGLLRRVLDLKPIAPNAFVGPPVMGDAGDVVTTVAKVQRALVDELKHEGIGMSPELEARIRTAAHTAGQQAGTQPLPTAMEAARARLMADMPADYFDSLDRTRPLDVSVTGTMRLNLKASAEEPNVR